MRDSFLGKYCLSKNKKVNFFEAVLKNGAREGTRTPTIISREILNLLCLPFHHPGNTTSFDSNDSGGWCQTSAARKVKRFANFLQTGIVLSVETSAVPVLNYRRHVIHLGLSEQFQAFLKAD